MVNIFVDNNMQMVFDTHEHFTREKKTALITIKTPSSSSIVFMFVVANAVLLLLLLFQVD